METVRNTTNLFARRALLLAATLIAAVVFFAARPARAEVTTYSTSKRTYKVGILLIDSSTVPGQEGRGPENPDPFVFYIADQRSDIKPQGWDLVNPLAPATVTADIFNRWSKPGSNPNVGRDPSHPYQIGQTVTKDMAAYWEVSLSKATEEELEQYDLLFITNHRTWSMTAPEREKLRKVVDAGAVVWIEDCGGMRIGTNGPFFLNQVQFTGSATGNGIGGPDIRQPGHPILNSPYTLSFTEIANLGDKNYGNFYHATQDPNSINTSNILPTAPNPETLVNVVGNTNTKDANGVGLPYISAGVYGSGAVVVTSSDSGCDINDYVNGGRGGDGGSGGNSGAYCGSNIMAAHVEDLKFAYNVIAWGSSNNTYRRDNRRTAASFSDVTAPLSLSFDFSDGLPAGATPAQKAAVVNSVTAPLISQGILYVSGLDQDGNVTLRAYDTIPNRDYDNDGNNDDGIQDLIKGEPYDEIWRWTGKSGGGNQPSAPVLAKGTVGGIAKDFILLTLPDGTVAMFEARPLDPTSGFLAPAQNAGFPVTNLPHAMSGTYVSATNLSAPAPVFYNNKIYAVEPVNAVVRCIDVNTFATLWHSSDGTNQKYAPTGSPTLGLNRLTVGVSRSGNPINSLASTTNDVTNDVMLYVPVIDTTNPTTGNPANARLLPFFLGSRTEGSNQLLSNGTVATMRLRPATTYTDYYFMDTATHGTNPASDAAIQQTHTQLYADVLVDDKKGNPDSKVLYTREDNFAHGRTIYPVPDALFKDGTRDYTIGNTTTTGGVGTWAVMWEVSPINSNYYDGKAMVTRNGNSADPVYDRLLLVADYDVAYVPENGAAPPKLTSGDPGHRDTRNSVALVVPNVKLAAGVTSLDTVGFSANDQLLFGANQNVAGSKTSVGSMSAVQEREYPGATSTVAWRFLFNGSPGAHTIGTTPVNDDAPFAPLVPGNARMVGSPVVTNDGVTYALATDGANTIVAAFKTTPQIVLNLGEALPTDSAVTISQWDPIKQKTIAATSPSCMDVDYDNGRITITDFSIPNSGDTTNGSDYFSASSTFVVSYTKKNAQPGDKPGEKPFSPRFTLSQTGTDPSIQGGYTPLLWYYVLPGTPSGSPVKIGDQLFLNIGNTVVAVDADPTSKVSIPLGTAVPSAYNTTLWSLPLSGGPGFAVSGDEGILAVNTKNGTSAFAQTVTLIADATRILEVDASGAATWATTATDLHRTVGGVSPIYLPDASGNIVPVNVNSRGVESDELRPFKSPQSVHRLSSSDYLVADTGNNRAVRFDRAAQIRWTVSRVSDPFGVLAPGDPVTLNTPTDVITRTLTTFSAGARIGYEEHYLIADSGNGRVIDVVDYYTLRGLPQDPQNLGLPVGSPVTGVVVWTTRTRSRGGANLAYTHLSLTATTDPANGNNFGKPFLVASVASSSVAAANNGDLSNATGGSVVRLDYNPINTGFILVNSAGQYQTVQYYWRNVGALIPEPATNGQVLTAFNEVRFVSGGGTTYTTKRLRGTTYYEQIPLDLSGNGTPQPVYLLADADGVYVCLANINTTTGKSTFDVVWKFDQSDYNTMNGTRFSAIISDYNSLHGTTFNLPIGDAPKFSPSSVKRLANGNYLITNSAAGSSALFAGGRFFGEVFEVKPSLFQVAGGTVSNTIGGGTFMGFSAPALALDKSHIPNPGPPTSGTVPLVQQMGGTTNGAAVTEQPRSADRL